MGDFPGGGMSGEIIQGKVNIWEAVASLGWCHLGWQLTVSPLFFRKKVTTCRVSPPDLFYLSNLVCPLSFVNSATIFFLSGGVTPGCQPAELKTETRRKLSYPVQ